MTGVTSRCYPWPYVASAGRDGASQTPLIHLSARLASQPEPMRERVSPVASPSDPPSVARATLPYVWAVAAVALGVAARSMLGPWIGSALPFITLYPAVFVAAVLGGFGPGVVATMLSAVMALHLFIDPAGSLALTDPVARFGVALFTASGLATVLARRSTPSRPAADEPGTGGGPSNRDARRGGGYPGAEDQAPRRGKGGRGGDGGAGGRRGAEPLSRRPKPRFAERGRAGRLLRDRVDRPALGRRGRHDPARQPGGAGHAGL